MSLNKDREYLIHLECSLAGTSIAQGLTLLGKSHFSRNGYGLQSFFMLTIGIERLLKLILIFNYRRLNNDSFPPDGYLKKFSHDIDKLYAHAQSIADEITCSDLYKELSSDPIFELILGFFTLFAKTSRYSNLDQLQGPDTKNIKPLEDWNAEINEEILRRHSTTRSAQKGKAIKEVGSRLDDIFFVDVRGPQGKKIDSVTGFLNEELSLPIKQKHSVMYVYKIVQFLCKLLDYLDTWQTPYVKEYFQLFTYPPNDIKSKKSWDIYKRW